MEFYYVLAVSTASIAGLAGVLYLRTGSLSFPLGVLFLYFWSLHGGWAVVADGLGEETRRHHYLYDKVFPVDLDQDYIWTLILYAGFIIVIELTALYGVRRGPVSVNATWPAVRISHGSILVMSVIAGLASFMIVKEQLATAAILGKSGYAVTRGGLGEMVPLFTLHQVLNRVALFSLAIGIAVWLVGHRGKWLVGTPTVLTGVGYVCLLGGFFLYMTVLGNKNELFSALILGGLFYLANAKLVRWGMMSVVAGLVFSGIALVDFLRAFPVMGLWEDIDWWDAFQWLPEIRTSNEAFGAHFSLYGVLHFHSPLTYGSSFVSLLASVVPRIVWPDRPGDIYAHYAASVGVVQGVGEQGFSIHHATGWFLNFGLAGLIVGAVLWGWVWSRCFNAYALAADQWCNMARWQYIFAVLAPWGFVACIPPLVRAGIEGYKGFVIDGLLIPTVTITIASYGSGIFNRLISGLIPGGPDTVSPMRKL